jgi:hypothetical protein
MSKYLFVGEKRSALARKMNVTWEDGRLAAKHLFTALERSDIEVANCDFKNVFREILEYNQVNKTAVREIKKFDGIVVAMGRKVEKVLKENNIEHKFIYHPATRGSYRNINKYCEHFKTQINGKIKIQKI